MTNAIESEESWELCCDIYLLYGMELKSVIGRASGLVIGLLEKFFYRWGRLVATFPKTIIVLSVLAIGLCTVGFVVFRVENDAQKLWLPEGSSYLYNKEWREENFVESIRFHSVFLTEEENVMTREGMLKLLEVHDTFRNVEVHGRKFRDVCYKLPITDLTLADQKKRRRRRRQATTPESDDEDDYDYYGGFDYTNYYDELNETEKAPSAASGDLADRQIDELPMEIYCDIIETLSEKCFEYSVLELWHYDEKVIRNLTTEQIIKDVNDITKSPIFGYFRDYANEFGHKTFDSDGRVVAAKAVRSTWLTKFDGDSIEKDDGLVSFSLFSADRVTMEWEAKMIETLLNVSETEKENGYTILFNVQRSFNDVTTSGILFDIPKLAAGYGLMFIYTMFMLGKASLVEHRTYLAIAGINSVGMGVAAALGLTMAVGLYYTTLHGIMIFLCLGIGIDDMFVVLQCWENIRKETEGFDRLPVSERVARTMRNAGVAVTVTSLTDIVAFAVGAVTILPGLRAFCVSCAFAIAAIYVLQVSWFVAWLTLDQRRIDAKRDGFFPCCVKHEKYRPTEGTETEDGRVQKILGAVARILEFRVVKVLVLLATAALLGVGAYGTHSIKVEFDPILLLPTDTYLRHWMDYNNEAFPTNGWGAWIYTGKFDYTEENFERLENMTNALQNTMETKGFLKNVNIWWTRYKEFLDEVFSLDWRTAARSGDAATYLSDFLHHTKGAQDKAGFRFDGELECNKPAPNATTIRLGIIDYILFDSPGAHIPARAEVERIIQETNFTTHSFSDGQIYSAWQTDEVIFNELGRNIGLAFLAVFIITFTLLADIRCCLFVLTCVALTLVDVVGLIHFWGLTIDTISCVSIILVIGLCVDYSAHIAHAYLVLTGVGGDARDTQRRASRALTQMGPAILNGGITTFLALVFLSLSNTYAYVVFFKVFFLSVILGLFHGLIFLPVALALLGPKTSHAQPTGKASAAPTTTEVVTVPTDSKNSVKLTGARNLAFASNLGGENGNGGVRNKAFSGEDEDRV